MDSGRGEKHHTRVVRHVSRVRTCLYINARLAVQHPLLNVHMISSCGDKRHMRLTMLEFVMMSEA